MIGPAMRTGANTGVRVGLTESEREPAKTDQGVIPGRPRVRDTLSHL